MNRVPERDVIVIGGSEGSIQPLRAILSSFPIDLPAAVFVVVHVAPDAPASCIASIADVGPLPAALARDGESIEHGRIYVAPPDHHVLIRPDQISVVRGPHENRVRPSIDPTLRTAANVFGARVIAVILSGNLNDGTYGAMVVKARGGIVIAQDPAEAEQPGMPQSIIDHSHPDCVLETAAIGARILSWVEAPMPDDRELQQSPIDPGPDELERVASRIEVPEGVLAPYTCPECHGPLWLKQDGSLSRFRCHTGHAFTGEVLIAAQESDLESALWSAVRALDEQADLLTRLGKSTRGAGSVRTATRQLERAAEAESRAELIRARLLL